MERIFTTAPIPMSLLKRKFTEDVEYVLDYSKSAYKNREFITYLSNLDTKCRLSLPDQKEALELAIAYMHSTMLTSIKDLEDIVVNLLLAYQGQPNFLAMTYDDARDLFKENKEIFDVWIRRLHSTILYAHYVQHEINEEGELVRIESEELSKCQVDEDDRLGGINFVYLLDHELFPLLLQKADFNNLSYNVKIFNDYMFKGANLFNFFANENNPVFIAITAKDDPEALLEISSAMEGECAVLPALFRELNNVSSI